MALLPVSVVRMSGHSALTALKMAVPPVSILTRSMELTASDVLMSGLTVSLATKQFVSLVIFPIYLTFIHVFCVLRDGPTVVIVMQTGVLTVQFHTFGITLTASIVRTSKVAICAQE